MSRILTYCLGLVVMLSACQEKREIIPVVPGGDKVVLLEEFTGKGCTNCPKGSREIDNLLAIYDTNLVVVSIHAGFFANPEFFDVGDYDLRVNPEGDGIFEMLGPNIGYPAGVTNRTEFMGDYQHGAQAWTQFIAEELESEPRVEFALEQAYDSTSRVVEIDVAGIAKDKLDGDVRISVMITESGIVDAQDDKEAGGIVDDYTHNHVLRGMATPFDGATVANGLALGENFSGTYQITLSNEWNAEECSLLVFVSEVNGSKDIKVLQALEEHLVE